MEKQQHPFDKLIIWIQSNPKWVLFWFFIFLLISFIIIPVLITQFSGIIQFNEKSGAIGDTIGGIVNPFVALFAAFLTFIAFWTQYKANEQLKKDALNDRIEGRVFELIKLYQENVSNLKFNDKELVDLSESINGRDVFKFLNEEINFCYQSILAFLGDNRKNIPDFRKYCLNMAYNFSFCGIDAVGFIDQEVLNDENYVKLCKRLFKDDLYPKVEAVKNRVSGCLTSTPKSKQSKIEFRDVFDC